MQFWLRERGVKGAPKGRSKTSRHSYSNGRLLSPLLENFLAGFVKKSDPLVQKSDELSWLVLRHDLLNILNFIIRLSWLCRKIGYGPPFRGSARVRVRVRHESRNGGPPEWRTQIVRLTCIIDLSCAMISLELVADHEIFTHFHLNFLS